MRIVIDAYGGDNAPKAIVEGASLACRQFGADITLVGKEKEIREIITSSNLCFNENLKIVDTDDVIDMHDEPTSILKEHRNSSMGLAFFELSEGKADAFVSAGSTGAIVVGGTLIVKRLKGVKRPALAGIMPSVNGNYMLMDMGANADCRPEMLKQFAVMADVYLKNVSEIKSPKIGLLNIGAESTKGDELHTEAYKLLSQSDLNFIGNVEARDMPLGAADAVITDGFSGNIALKTMEGTAISFFSQLKKVMHKSLKNKLAAAVLKSDLYKIKKMMDSSEVGGAPLLGVNKPVIKAHGSSDAKAIMNAVRQAIIFYENDVIEKIGENINK